MYTGAQLPEEEVRSLASLATAAFVDAEVRPAMENAYFLMARYFGWPDLEARDGDWYAALMVAMELLRAKAPDLAAVYNERMDRQLVALIVQRWVPDEWLEAAVREEFALHMKGIERLPDRPSLPVE